MKKNPILIFTGLAIAAVAGVAGLTRDRWIEPRSVAGNMAEQPPAKVIAESQPDTAPAPTPAAQQQAAAPAPAIEPAATPAEAQPAPAPAAEQPAAPVVAAAQQPASPPVVEEPAAPAVVAAQQPASPPVAEQPAAPVVAAEQPLAPAVTVIQKQAAAPAVEQPTPPVPAAEQPASAPAIAEEPPAPTFDTVRVETTGEAVIAGRAEAGSEVVVKLDGQAIGKATANAEGAFVVVPDAPLPAGSGALTIEASSATRPVPSESVETVAVIVPAADTQQQALVAVMSPTAPTKVLQRPEPVKPAEPEAPQVAAVQPEAAPVQPEVAPAQPEAQPQAVPAKPMPPAPAKPMPPARVSLDAVDYDAGGAIVFSGRGEPGTGARIYVDNGIVGDAPVGGNGRWSFSGTTGVAAGVHALRIDGIGAGGKVINRIEVPFFREETQKVAAAAPAEAPQPAPPAETQTAPRIAATEDQQQAAAVAEKPKDGRVVIQPGNNLWRISKVIYGAGIKYTLLFEANKDQIRDPDMIYPGQVFKTPDVVPPESIDPQRRDQLTPEESAASAQ